MIHGLGWEDLPDSTRAQARLCLLDLIGVAAGGATTRLSRIIRAHASDQFGGHLPMLFDGRTASASGVALAAGMTIDALDGHDGYNPAKGHVGCGLFAGLLATGGQANGREILTATVLGYELGSRLAVTLHGSVTDYHTSGAWVAVTAAAAAARLTGLDAGQTAHALGIAEYHGPRSQMMRCIDHPTMLKDGSGWGAMAGVSAAYLARDGFTGAPAITMDGPAWSDLGSRWLILEQYFKPYPVCRWAQAPVEAVLTLRRTHGLTSADVTGIAIETFHEATRLAVNTPATTEEAQYSTSFPTAVALVRGRLGPADIADDALDDPEIRRMSQLVRMTETDRANDVFPGTRLARVTLTLASGKSLTSDWHEPRWSHDAPPTGAELRAKYHDLADDILGPERAKRIEEAVDRLGNGPASDLFDLLAQPIRSDTTRPSVP
jgi:2-methylcitrate dehydratase PrpD